ncbi:hypothetical protein PRIPAC_87129 [Pristionchus pacificus]|uniref:Uncharacterized protein n=1 Tax=Pristionchus pacificus TaxID=54126 RepID=A0A2A6B7K9_PRIPA|nr:hypothetical protein PRIPAC_87129 [Pristionchus pacificus]|eukprot:PDM61847.1 hypothetical protein PRIPAC_51289 [Pristionchus pacificus]
MFHILISLIFLPSVTAQFDFDQCNVTKGCWFHPPNCMSTATCLSGVEWEVRPAGVLFTLRSFVTDLGTTRPTWIAVGLSLNQRMDDDTVLECVRRADGDGIVRMSFNDETHNSVLHQASASLLSEQAVTFQDGLFTCSASLSLAGRDQLAASEQFKVHDLNVRPYYLLFARGTADPYSLEKDIHSTNDGPTFPWITEDTVSFCIDNCTLLGVSPSEPILVTQMHQTRMERYWRYRVAVMHGVAMLLGWWVLGSNGIIIARYFKPLFPRRKLLGTAVWFQFHRDMMITGLLLEIAAVICIFWQAGWVWYECSYECTSDDFAKKMHAITGVFGTALAVIQLFLAVLRPAPDSNARPIFNWAHWLIGMTAWCLNRVYGHVPNYIMGGYIITFCLTNIILEMIATTYSSTPVRAHKIGPSGMAMSILNGPTTESNVAEPKRTSARLFIFGVHLIISLAVAITITVMLVRIMYSHSP